MQLCHKTQTSVFCLKFGLLTLIVCVTSWREQNVLQWHRCLALDTNCEVKNPPIPSWITLPGVLPLNKTCYFHLKTYLAKQIICIFGSRVVLAASLTVVCNAGGEKTKIWVFILSEQRSNLKSVHTDSLSAKLVCLPANCWHTHTQTHTHTHGSCESVVLIQKQLQPPSSSSDSSKFIMIQPWFV